MRSVNLRTVAAFASLLRGTPQATRPTHRESGVGDYDSVTLYCQSLHDVRGMRVGDEAEATMSIAELAEQAGVTSRTIRYYVAEGVLPPPSGRGQRRAYGPEHFRLLGAIREWKAQYLPLHEIRKRLASTANGPAHAPVVVANVPAAAVATAQPSSMAPSFRVAASVVGASQQEPPVGFGPPPATGRIELHEPPETVWHRVNIASGVEIHYRDTDNPRLAAAIKRLLHEAGDIIDGRSRS